MGYAVLHMEKAIGSDSGMSAHIERTIAPKNADASRTHLNWEMINFPDGVTNRTEAIQHRLETAGLQRKIGKNQVRAVRIMLSGSPDDMKRIEQAGKLDDWCRDNLDWLKKTYGAENIVSAVVHLDETTPHIHATMIPIVTGERRKAKTEQVAGKKKYRKKSTDTARLCADDVMSRVRLKEYQNTYAEQMAKYGLQRGIDGSEAKHISTPQYYRELFAQNEDLKESIDYLEEENQEVYERIRDMYDRKDEAREKFLNLYEYTRQKEAEISNLETRIEQLKQDYEPYKAQDDINLLFDVFPHLPERLQVAQLCKGIGLATDIIKRLFKGELLSFTGKLYSPEHDQSFNVQDAKLQLFKESKDSYRLKLSINGQNIIDWFKQRFDKIQHTIKPHIKPIPLISKNGRGI